jgi:hypothetical protein
MLVLWWKPFFTQPWKVFDFCIIVFSLLVLTPAVDIPNEVCSPLPFSPSFVPPWSARLISQLFFLAHITLIPRIDSEATTLLLFHELTLNLLEGHEEYPFH